MKNTGIEWMGEIPNDWEVKRFNYVVQLRQEKGQFQSNDKFLGLENIESASGKFIETDTHYTDMQADVYCKGDVLFSKLRPYLAKVFFANDNGYCTGEFLVFKNFCGERKYLFYLLLSSGFIDIVNSSTYGTKMPRANWDFIRNLYIPFPPLPAQTAIANFLDHKCKKIDALIENQEKVIAELAAYKKSLIQKVTTKGLGNSEKRLVNSGVEWIGEIPEGWKIGRIKFVVSEFGSGTTPESGNDLYYAEEGHFWIQSGDLYNTTFIYDTKKKITDLALEKCKSLTKYRNNFLLIAMYGASIGNVAISKIDAYVNQACFCLKTDNNNDLKFLYYCLFATCKENLLEKSFGGTQPNINSGIILNQIIPIPPLPEQQAIADYLDKKTSEVDSLISLKQQKITQLKEYKKSLIYEYVTGKRIVISE